MDIVRMSGNLKQAQSVLTAMGTVYSRAMVPPPTRIEAGLFASDRAALHGCSTAETSGGNFDDHTAAIAVSFLQYRLDAATRDAAEDCKGA
ncbi:MAG: hypothetical protein JKY56_23075 [Kofleriaceae bacterium]|nr:hypothetical protein [Kofleriaceae bacterium]